MTMNCKVGSVAMIRRSYAHNEGKVVTCLEFIGKIPGSVSPNTDFWRVDTPIRGIGLDGRPSEFFTHYVRDYCLQPLIYTPDKDEMLIIAGDPGKDRV